MSRSWIRPIPFVLALCAASVPVVADLADHPGYVDFGAAGFASPAAVDVTLGQDQVLQLVAASAPDPDAAALAAKVQGFRLRQYAAPDAQALAAADTLMRQLAAAGWIEVRRDSLPARQLIVLARSQGDGVAGLAIFIVAPGRLLAVANLVGDLPPDRLRHLGLPLPP